MFKKTFPLIPCLLSPPPASNVDYLDSTTLCNTKITIFNIDMGEGGKNSEHITEKLKKNAFPTKIFAQDCSSRSSPVLLENKDIYICSKLDPQYFCKFYIFVHTVVTYFARTFFLPCNLEEKPTEDVSPWSFSKIVLTKYYYF